MSSIPRHRPLATSEVFGRVAVITIQNPPVNALNRQLTEDLVHLVSAAAADQAIEAVVLIGAEANFIAGVDIRELQEYASSGAVPFDLYQLPRLIEDCPKPLVAAVHGAALGGGLEIALAAHFRIAARGAQLGLPEVKLGLIPGMAGTQRLPRLIGIEKAAQLCLTGEPVAAREALTIGLIDRLAEGDLLQAALAFLAEEGGRDIRRTGALPATGESAAPPTELIRKQARRYGGAPRAAFEAIAASTLPFADGCAVEKRMFEQRLQSVEARALMRVFFAERTVSKVSGTPRIIQSAGVVGGGAMGSGIAIALLDAGLHVTIRETDRTRTERAASSIAEHYRDLAARHRLSESTGAERVGRLSVQADANGFDRLDLVIEAVFENLAVKQAVFAELTSVTHPDCLLATNTSSLDIDRIAQGVAHPQRVLGLHFFNPAPVARLVEVVRAQHTSDDTLATGVALARQLKKIGVPARNAPGFIGNRVFAPYLRVARELAAGGVAVARIDHALVAWGMAMGPLAVDDLIGLDVSLSIEEELARTLPGAPGPTDLLRTLVASGYIGNKGPHGGWQNATAFRPDSVEMDDEDIVKRCIDPLVAEARRVVEDGVAGSAVAVDIVAIHGFGYPAWRGGPLFASSFADHS